MLPKKQVILFFITFSLVLHAQKKTTNANYSKMLQQLLAHTVHEVLPNEIHASHPYIFLDAREKKEYLVSHIKNARWVGFENFNETMVKNIPKNKPIIVYCSVGYRSEKITEKLLKMGFSNVSNLYGGIFEWVHCNKEVFNSKNTKTTKIHTYDKQWAKWLNKGEKIY